MYYIYCVFSINVVLFLYISVFCQSIVLLIVGLFTIFGFPLVSEIVCLFQQLCEEQGNVSSIQCSFWKRSASCFPRPQMWQSSLSKPSVYTRTLFCYRVCPTNKSDNCFREIFNSSKDTVYECWVTFRGLTISDVNYVGLRKKQFLGLSDNLLCQLCK